MKARLLPITMLLAACAGGSQGTASNATPENTVKAFLAAARDTNTSLMASYWGGPAGPAGQTKQPPDYQKRIDIMQRYLANDSVSVVSLGRVPGDTTQVQVTVRLFRGNCRPLVPVTVGPWKHLWLVQDVALAAAGSPARPCDQAGNPL